MKLSHEFILYEESNLFINKNQFFFSSKIVFFQLKKCLNQNFFHLACQEFHYDTN